MAAEVTDAVHMLAAEAVNSSLPELRHYQVAQAIVDAEQRGEQRVRDALTAYAAKCREDAATHAEAAAQHLRLGNYRSAITASLEAEALRRLASEFELAAAR